MKYTAPMTFHERRTFLGIPVGPRKTLETGTSLTHSSEEPVIAKDVYTVVNPEKLVVTKTSRLHPVQRLTVFGSEVEKLAPIPTKWPFLKTKISYTPTE